MSELTLFLIRLAYLAILWIFVLSALSVIRSDMFGARVPEGARPNATPTPRGKNKGAPKLGWCWAKNHHTWLGFASTAGRRGPG